MKKYKILCQSQNEVKMVFDKIEELGLRWSFTGEKVKDFDPIIDYSKIAVYIEDYDVIMSYYDDLGKIIFDEKDNKEISIDYFLEEFEREIIKEKEKDFKFYKDINAYKTRLNSSSIETDLNLNDVLNICSYKIGLVIPDTGKPYYMSSVDAWLRVNCKDGYLVCKPTSKHLPEYLKPKYEDEEYIKIEE